VIEMGFSDIDTLSVKLEAWMWDGAAGVEYGRWLLGMAKGLWLWAGLYLKLWCGAGGGGRGRVSWGRRGIADCGNEGAGDAARGAPRALAGPGEEGRRQYRR
jgi:hypothetical protein